mmetsp:Transcript_2423/g.4239  ORF Transcript_2423/g.4239 Transcript_2423/m.4239 type:complete len:104 (-) Transcript_2423:147-458(-)
MDFGFVGVCPGVNLRRGASSNSCSSNSINRCGVSMAVVSEGFRRRPVRSVMVRTNNIGLGAAEELELFLKHSGSGKRVNSKIVRHAIRIQPSVFDDVECPTSR